LNKVINKINNEQIALNVTIEEMLLEYKSELFKFNNKKKIFDYRIKKYDDNIRKFQKYSNTNVGLRADLYLTTCEEMIKKSKNYINDIAEEVKSKEEFLKHEIWKLLFETLVNNVIHKDTIVNKNNWLVYSLPSAKIYFKKQIIIIDDEEELYNFLVENKIEKKYLDIDQNVLIEILRKDLYLCDDGSISNSDGLIFKGLSLSAPDIKIKLNND